MKTRLVYLLIPDNHSKSNIVAAINELDGEIGDLSGLTTTNKSTLVAAINELNIAAHLLLVQQRKTSRKCSCTL